MKSYQAAVCVFYVRIERSVMITDVKVDAMHAASGLHQLTDFAPLPDHHVLLLVPQNALLLLLFNFLMNRTPRPPQTSLG